MRVPKVLSLRRSRKLPSQPLVSFPSPPNTPHSLLAHLSIQPPKKVIKALYDYDAKSPDELSFHKGDFFHAIHFDEEALWWEAFNPVTGLRGMVPVSYFQILAKNEASSTCSSPLETSYPNGALETLSSPRTTSSDTSPPPKVQPPYGIVLYDFQAERDDELQASAGDPIIVIAQSNEEWYVAKLIGKLGGPGLIPVSFVEIRDPVTGAPVSDVEEMFERSGQKIPTVDEWKKITADYNAAVIDLNTPDSILHTPVTSTVPESCTQDGSRRHHSRNDIFGTKRMSTGCLPSPRQSAANGSINSSTFSSDLVRSTANGEEFKNVPVGKRISSASATGYELVDDQYVFRVTVELQLPDRIRTLLRKYNDFYVLQIALLDAFPHEAGRTPEHGRILPFMPGPLAIVNESITSQRCIDLDSYLKELLALPPYILMHPAIELFFSVQSGNGRDIEVLTPLPQRTPQTITRRHTSDSITPSNRSAFSSHTFSQPSILHTQQQLFSSPTSSPATSPPFTPIKDTFDVKSKYHLDQGREEFVLPSSAQCHLADDAAVVRAWAIQQFDTYSPPVSAVADFPVTARFPTFSTEIKRDDSNDPSNNAKQPTTLKVKVVKGEDIIAIRVPAAVDFSELHNRIADRLDVKEEFVVAYKDTNGRCTRMRTDDDLQRAIGEGGGKLLLYAFD